MVELWIHNLVVIWNNGWESSEMSSDKVFYKWEGGYFKRIQSMDANSSKNRKIVLKLTKFSQIFFMGTQKEVKKSILSSVILKSIFKLAFIL